MRFAELEARVVRGHTEVATGTPLQPAHDTRDQRATQHTTSLYGHYVRTPLLACMMLLAVEPVTCDFELKFSGAAVNVNASSREILLLPLLRARDVNAAKDRETPEPGG